MLQGRNRTTVEAASLLHHLQLQKREPGCRTFALPLPLPPEEVVAAAHCMSLVSEKVRCADADFVVVDKVRDFHQPTLTLIDIFDALTNPHQRDTYKEAVARWVKEWPDAPYVLSLIHPSPEFTRALLTLLVVFLYHDPTSY